MDRWQNRVAVVTGASSGIGCAIARDLANAGMVVVALGRRKERIDGLRASLSSTVQSRFHSVKCDVSDLSSVTQTFDWIEAKLGGIDVLVNNAAIFKPGSLATQEVSELQAVLQTNVMGVIYCTQRAFKSMKSRNFDGHVILINSIVGHYIFSPPDIPNFSIYPVTKFGITAMTEILRQEFRGLQTKIKITSVSPGLVDTEIVPENYKNLTMLKPEDISSGVLYAISTPLHVQIHELTIKPVGETF